MLLLSNDDFGFLAKFHNHIDFRHSVKVIPILVGAVSAETEAMYGKLLAKYADDPKNFFSVSSDFCHWGSR